MIKVIQFGLGPIGNKITSILLEKKNIRITGAVDISDNLIGKDIGILAGLPYTTGIKVVKTIKEISSKEKADIAVLTTTSGLQTIKSQVLELVSAGYNIVSTCEELTYPWLTNPAIAKEIDDAAKLNGVTVLSTGVNPGFLMDFIPSSLTAICKNVKKIKIERIQDAQFRRIPFQQKIGAGLTPAEFKKKKNDGSLRHVGLTESIQMVAAGLGWHLEKTEDIIEPIIAEQDFNSNGISIQKGNALGVQQFGKGFVNNEEVISLIFRAAVGQPNPRDRVYIDGIPEVDMTIKNGINGDIATCSITINAIPVVVKAQAGLKTMIDIPPITYSD
jgi:4-hydroxy-tetrahydrodipicolinate reductase